MATWLERYQSRQQHRVRQVWFVSGLAVVVPLAGWLAIGAPGVYEPADRAMYDDPGVPTVTPPADSQTVVQEVAEIFSKPARDDPSFLEAKRLYWHILMETLDPVEIEIAKEFLTTIETRRVGQSAKEAAALTARIAQATAVRTTQPGPSGPSRVVVAESPRAQAPASPQASPQASPGVLAQAGPAVSGVVTPRPAPAISPAATVRGGGATAPVGPATLESEGRGLPSVAWFESVLPIMIKTFEDRFATSMKLVGERETTQKYTDRDFQDLVVRELRARFPQQFQDLSTQFRPDGLSGSWSMRFGGLAVPIVRSEEHTSELQSRLHLVCRLLLEKKKKPTTANLNF